jgi:predicted ATPase/DNA-binding winged helix-turn-helix (wHTH) protein
VIQDDDLVAGVGTAKINFSSGQISLGGESWFLGRRPLEILRVLWDSAGDLVTKDQLVLAVWGKESANENALQAQIAAIRRMLGENRTLLETVRGRGYLLRASPKRRVRQTKADWVPAERRGQSPPPMSPAGIPGVGSNLVGRDEAIEEVIALVHSQSLVSLVGVGGIGKTRLALALAHVLRGEFSGGVGVAELASIREAELIPITVASAFGLQPPAGTHPTELLVSALAASPRLLVLDNCEHVIEGASRFVDTLLRSCPNLRVIATSREPLRIDGEYVYRVAALSFPMAGETLVRPESYSAVQLFIERASRLEGPVPRDEESLAGIAEIVRRLDGLPIAIELAAARTQLLGITGVAANLHDRFALLAGGRRTASPRQQTLRATFDWSFSLLSRSEQMTFARLGTFPDSFTLDDASAALSWGDLAAEDVEHAIASLVAKSMISQEPGCVKARFRLFESLRRYAEERLAQSGESREAIQRFASFVLGGCAVADQGDAPPSEAPAALLANLRAALEWGYSAAGNRRLAIELTAASVGTWYALGLMAECRKWVERALNSESGWVQDDLPLRLRLHAALGGVLQYLSGWTPALEEAWREVLEIATQLDDTNGLKQAHWGLWLAYGGVGRHNSALEHARLLSALEDRVLQPRDLHAGYRLVGTSLHFLGRQDEAAHALRQMLLQPATSQISGSRFTRFDYDQRVAAQIMASRVKWLQGQSQAAIAIASDAIARSDELGHAATRCHALAGAMPVCIGIGDVKRAQGCLERLIEVTTECGFHFWGAMARGWKGVLGVRLQYFDEALTTLDGAIRDVSRAQFVPYLSTFRTAEAEALMATGRLAAAGTVLDTALGEAQQTDDRWFLPELMRVKAEFIAISAPNRVEEAEDLLATAYGLAKSGGAKAWQLRIAASTARLARQTGRPREGLAQLARICREFDHRFPTDDLVAAEQLLRNAGEGSA